MRVTVAQIGFTLVELMIVVAVVGILAAVAIPSYQDYVTRARVTDALMLASGAKAAVSETAINDGFLPAANGSTGWSGASTNNVSSVNVTANGVVRVQFAAAAGPLSGQTLTLTPVISGTTTTWTTGNPVGWICAIGNASLNRYVPAECRI